MSDLNICNVVPVVLMPHGNADSLSIVKVYDGYYVVVRTVDWVNDDRGIYVPPDNLVNTKRPEFSFLDEGIIGRDWHRVKTKKLRGVMSQGLLVPVPKIAKYDWQQFDEYMFNIGDDVTEYLEVKRYVTPEDTVIGGDSEVAPPIPGPGYDVESWFKYKRQMPDGLPVVITEKLHGTNARFTYQEDKMHCSSRQFYRKQSVGNVYWRALLENPWIEDLCKSRPGLILYGEIHGWVQSLRYGAVPNQLFFKAFDVWENGKFLDFQEAFDLVTNNGFRFERYVPVLMQGPISDELVEKYMDGKSTLADHIKEGVVIKPLVETFCHCLYNNRLQLKAVSPEYLSKEK